MFPWGNTIYKRTMRFFLIMMLITLTFFSLMYKVSENIRTTYASYLDSFYFVNSIDQQSENLLFSVQQYLTNRTKKAKDNVEKEIQSIQSYIPNLNNNSFDEHDMIYIDHIRKLLNVYVEEAERTILLASDENTDLYAEGYLRLKEVHSWIQEEVSLYISKKLIMYNKVYENTMILQYWLDKMFWSLLLFLGSFIFYHALRFSGSLAQPIRLVASHAQKLAEGQFNSSLPESSNQIDEVKVLLRSFNNMQKQLQERIWVMKEKERLQKKLQEEMIKSAEKLRLIQESELKYLQSQINPHFLFNTLNMLSKSALLEGAALTSDLIVTTADLMRYSFKETKDGIVLLRDEINHARNYCDILQARFGKDKVRFIFDIDERYYDLCLPKLTLQPLIENAFIHGLLHGEIQGNITVYIKDIEDHLALCVEDDGVGIQTSTIQCNANGEKLKANGTGLKNVQRRLELFYHQRAYLDIQSRAPSKGTKVCIVFPEVRGESCH